MIRILKDIRCFENWIMESFTFTTIILSPGFFSTDPDSTMDLNTHSEG